mmetsp:Transcript_29836/g.78711  ORF Transcript_29836/g.78711 Transcript_29836/m.78711 type:complete len:100 (+) Transcript_29836:162-461(+)
MAASPECQISELCCEGMQRWRVALHSHRFTTLALPCSRLDSAVSGMHPSRGRLGLACLPGFTRDGQKEAVGQEQLLFEPWVQLQGAFSPPATLAWQDDL